MVSYAGIAYRIFKNFAKKYSRVFADLDNSLKIAKIPYNVDEYFCIMLLTELLCFIFLLPSIFLVLYFSFKNLIIAIPGAILITIPLLGVVALIFYIYPNQVYNSKKKKIENILFFATVYMSTIAGTGAPPHTIFGIMSKFGEFGEVSKVAGEISRDVEVFGLDIADALSHSAERTPSENLKDLLWGIRSTVTSGGDLREFLSQKANGFAQEYRRKLEEFTRTLSLFLEMYITVIIVGTIFTLVMTSIMSLVGGFTEQLKAIQIMIMVLGLPFITFVYIIMLKSVSPKEV